METYKALMQALQKYEDYKLDRIPGIYRNRITEDQLWEDVRVAYHAAKKEKPNAENK